MRRHDRHARINRQLATIDGALRRCPIVAEARSLAVKQPASGGRK